jgi:hypothetical protein
VELDIVGLREMKGKKGDRLLTWAWIGVTAVTTALLLGFIPGLLVPSLQQKLLSGNASGDLFRLEPGDLLVRPNWNFLPGTTRVEGGRNFGHLAVVVQGAQGKSVGEVLQKALVIEALLFDQKSRRFIFGSSEIVRKTAAATSFGERFTGKRYLLRMPLTPAEQQRLVSFLTSQLEDDRYTVLSFKRDFTGTPGSREARLEADRDRWNCTTLAWYAFRYATGRDIDANGGVLIYPNDIIRCSLFDPPALRIRF